MSSESGSAGSDSRNSWTPVVPHDTTPEAAARQREWWLGLSEGERLQFMLDLTNAGIEARMGVLREEHPDASEAELTAIWTEERYRDSLPADFLARAVQAIRERDG